MKNKILYAATVLIVMLSSSCKKDFLDTQLQSSFDEELFFRSGFNNLKAFGMGVYNYLPQFNRYGNNALLAGASDEADFAIPNNLQRFNAGSWGPFSNPDNVYENYYRAIRHANLFLERTVEYPAMIVQDTINNKAAYVINLDDFAKLRAEVRFLRAFFYFELIKRYGGVPLVTKVISEEESYSIGRSTLEACVQFIVEECNEVIPELTNHYFNYGIPAGQTVGRGDGGTDVSRLGRIEKPAAMVLKQRALLYAASPLHNPSGDLNKWTAAAAAGQEIFSSPDAAHIRFLATNYKDLFTAQNTNNFLTPRKGSNSGIIMTRPFEVNGSTFERANYPAGITNGAQGATCPSQNLVDAFEMKNGLAINAPGSGYDPNNPYANRDNRLQFIVVVNNSVMGRNIDGTNRITESFVGGVDGIGAKFGATTTGYYLRKFSVENFDITKSDAKPKAWVLMRYAEVLLNFAEAMNEAFGPDAKPALNSTNATYSAREAINLVRARAGQPALPTGLTQAEMRSKIQNERRVELAFEEHRFFDVRRWKIAEQSENVPLRGMRVVRNLNGTFTYEPFNVENRVFDQKMYFHPIPFQEIAKSNGAIVQNPNWQ